MLYVSSLSTTLYTLVPSTLRRIQSWGPTVQRWNSLSLATNTSVQPAGILFFSPCLTLTLSSASMPYRVQVITTFDNLCRDFFLIFLRTRLRAPAGGGATGRTGFGFFRRDHLTCLLSPFGSEPCYLGR